MANNCTSNAGNRLQPLKSISLRSAALTGCFALIVLTQNCASKQPQPAGNVHFNIAFTAASAQTPLDGRVLMILAAAEQKGSGEKEPREQISDALDTQQIFGIDVENWKPDVKAVIDASVLGYPVKSLAQVPPGTYSVQAVLHKYETFKRSDGYTIKLPMDRGEGQHWNLAPGNLISKPKQITLDHTKPANFDILLDREIPPIETAKDTRYIKHVKIQSERLTEFWWRPMFLGAVLVPHGFEEHPEARYPLIVNHGHYPHTFGGFREAPPDANLKPDYRPRGLGWLVTTTFSRNTHTSSIWTGSARSSRASSSSKSSTPIRFMTIRTRSIRQTSGLMAMRSITSLFRISKSSSGA
jgi:hypothetical protein